MHSFPDPSDLSRPRALRAPTKDHITANHAIETLIGDDLSGRIVERVLVVSSDHFSKICSCLSGLNDQFFLLLVVLY